jgi:ribosomal-protein-alanine N-acetyltransferase
MRQVTRSDAKDLLEISFYDGVQALDPAEAFEMQNKINQDYLDGNSIHWAILDPQSEMLVGTCGYYRGFANNIGELGYILKPAFQGRGFMTKALKQAIGFGIHTIGLQMIIAITEKDNIKSQHVLSRLGFLEESKNDDYVTYNYPME